MFVFSPSIYTILLLTSLMLMMVVCIIAKKLTVPAAIAAAAIGYVVFLGAGVIGIVMLLAFFALSVLATAHRKDLKTEVREDGGSGRNIWQVFANGSVAAIMGVLMFIDLPCSKVYLMMMAASLASALADTLSSELGMVYGRRFYHVLTFKVEPKGLDGIVSTEGTLFGAAGSLVIALIYGGFSKGTFLVLFAGVLGNLADSILGAVLERKGYAGNNVVNFLNTLFAALAVLIFYILGKM